MDEYCKNETLKVLANLKRMSKHFKYIKHYYSTHSNNGIGTNTMLHVVVSQKDTDWKEEKITLTFDVTDYNVW